MSRFNGVKIGSKEGFTTYYDPAGKKFYLTDPEGNEVAAEDTQEKVEGAISQLIKDRFKLPIIAVRSSGNKYCKGRITSVNLDNNTAWFAYDDKQRRSAEKIYLGHADTWELTPANLVLVTQINELQDKQTELDKQIRQLEKQFEKPIDRQHFRVVQDEGAEH